MALIFYHIYIYQALIFKYPHHPSSESDSDDMESDWGDDISNDFLTKKVWLATCFCLSNDCYTVHQYSCIAGWVVEFFQWPTMGFEIFSRLSGWATGFYWKTYFSLRPTLAVYTLWLVPKLVLKLEGSLPNIKQSKYNCANFILLICCSDFTYS
jgi:hypothetical protein